MKPPYALLIVTENEEALEEISQRLEDMRDEGWEIDWEVH